ncbi:hypothetical protein P9272_02030 [Mesorhizobium sp. WSM4976]|uniref:hypothetical protein n=1 Tax=Mesorhizobium sp. WSM4976 TaxID=3038549 RepID=UPI002417FD6F|nr:hypothetical protein [Mesorhizobium sp. WSM4976]MDG4892381.1 hypothetical protein [Mesorhizobium sp. WSM4976]
MSFDKAARTQQYQRALTILFQGTEQTRRIGVTTALRGTPQMLLALNDAISTAVLAGRGADAEIFGVIDLTSKTETRIGALSLGHAIQFVANASVLGYDVRRAIVLYGESGKPSLRIWDCEHLWAQYGGALLQP